MNLASLKPSAILTKTTANEPFYANRMPSVHVRAMPFKGNFQYVQSSFWVGDVFLSTAIRWPSVTAGITLGAQTMVGMAMEEPRDLVFNGHRIQAPCLTIGANDCEYWASEGAPWTSAITIFPDDMSARGWPTPKSLHLVVAVSRPAMTALRQLIESLFRVASAEPEIFGVGAAVAGMRESIYAAYDNAFAQQSEMWERAAPLRHHQLLRKVDDLLADNISRPIYSDDVAAALNVTPRTLHSVMRRFNGMSLHRYLRLKRLWSVRWALISGGDRAIKSVALDHGFWHLGRFASDYKAMFGETPSETARRRGN